VPDQAQLLVFAARINRAASTSLIATDRSRNAGTNAESKTCRPAVLHDRKVKPTGDRAVAPGVVRHAAEPTSAVAHATRGRHR
jgi:hypothetical protein